MKSLTSIVMIAFLLLGLLDFVLGGPIAEDVVDALTVERTGQHYGPYDWEFELFREDNCGLFNNGSSVFHGYGSQDMAHEGGPLGYYSVKVSRIASACEAVFYDQPDFIQNTVGVSDSKIPKVDEHTRVGACLDRGLPTRSFQIKCAAVDQAKRDAQSSDIIPSADQKQDWKLELFSNKECNAASGGSIQTFMQVGDSTCLTDANKFGFDGVIVHGLYPGCSINFFSDESCSPDSLTSQIGTRPNPPINVCVPQNQHTKAWKVNCPPEKRSWEPTLTILPRSLVPLPMYQGPGPTPMVDAPPKYSFDLFEDVSCVPSGVASPGHYQQHFEGPGDTLSCQQIGATGNGFMGIEIQKLEGGCTAIFCEDNGCTQTVNAFKANDPTNSCRQFESMPGDPNKAIRSFIVRDCPFP